VEGEETLTWSSTERSSDEIYTYALDFHDDHCKVMDYQICTHDTCAAHVYSKGQLGTSLDRCSKCLWFVSLGADVSKLHMSPMTVYGV
jgi:hypothetical protein